MKKILLLHGALGCKEDMKELSAELKELGYNAHSLDFSGHGKKKLPEHFSIHLLANDVVEYLRNHEIDKIHIFGYTLGGYVGMYLAKYFPHLVDSLITLGTKFRWNPQAASEFIETIRPETIKKNKKLYEQLIKKHGKKVDQLIEKLIEFYQSMGTEAPLHLEEYLAIECETLILRGENDTWVTEEECLNVKDHILHSQYQVLSKTPRDWDKVNKKKLAKIIADFINNQNI
ncbi:MAG: alpha/beta hydrolase [Vicingaceae bacterium]|nr:MAG: alpha/beta hydrolase [Vicingaceae bacterium]